MLRLASIATILALVGCADTGDEGFIILNNTAISGESCTLSGSKDQPFISHGEIHLQAAEGYLLTPLLESRITLPAGVDETSRTIFLTGANVSLQVVATSLEQNGSFSSPSISLSGTNAQFSKLFSGSLPPSGTVNVGFDIIPVPTLRAIESQVGTLSGDARLDVEILATVTVLGKLGDNELEAPPFQFAVNVCTGCILVNAGTCPLAQPPTAGNACNPYQDGFLECCQDVDGGLICPATSM